MVLWNREIFYKTYQSLPLTVPKIVFFENFAYILLTDRSITAVYALRVRVVRVQFPAVRQMKKNSLPSYLYLIFGVGFFSAVFHGLGLLKILPWYLVYSDTLGFFERATAAGFPYISKFIEYPVITGLFIQLGGFLGESRAGYYWISVAGLIACAVIATYFLYQILPETQKGRLLRYWIFAPSMVIFLTTNWDILAITLVVAALYFFHKEKWYWGAFLLSLGFSTKFYPILYFLPLLIKVPRWKNRLAIIGIFVATTAALNGFFAYYHFDFWYYFYSLNALRDPNPDSVWTIIRYFIRPFEMNTVNWLSFVLFGGSYFYLILKNRKESLLKLFTIATLLFVLCNKIFSPQYLLWLLPFFVLMPEINGFPGSRTSAIPRHNMARNEGDSHRSFTTWFYLLEFSNLAAFFSILPWFFLGHDMFYFYLASPFVIIRHICLIAILFYAVKKKEIELRR